MPCHRLNVHVKTHNQLEKKKKKNQRKQSSRMIIKIFQNIQINYQQDDKKLSSYPTRDLLVLNKELLHHD